jgi:hypothetical protein
MTGNLKTFGLVLVAILVMSAVVAAAAQATAATFSWASGTTVIKKEADPELPLQEFTFTPGAITASFACDEVSGEATGITGTGGAELTIQKTEFSDTGTTPTAEECTGKVGGISLKVPVKFNGCDTKLTAGNTVAAPPAGRSDGTVHIECPEPSIIEIKAAGCLIKIGPQTLGPITYTTRVTPSGLEHITGEDHVGEAAGSENNNAIDYSTSGITCGAHSETDGTYFGRFTLTAFGGGTPKNLTVT